MDYLRITKKYFDQSEISIEIVVESKFIRAKLDTFVSCDQIISFSDKLQRYSKEYKSECSIELFHFKMKLFPIDKRGFVKIEIEMDILDNSDVNSNHSCSLFIHSNLQSIDDFGRRIRGILDREIGYEIVL